MKRIWIGALGLCCLLLGACASQQSVQLNYSPDRWAESCTGEVQLEPMHDARKETQFIVREGKVLKTDRDVPGWIQSALRDELELRGCRVVSPQVHDGPFSQPYRLGGTLYEARLRTSYLKQQLVLKFQITLEQGERKIFDKTYRGAWDTTDLPTQATLQELLSSSLEDMMKDVMADVSHVMQKK